MKKKVKTKLTTKSIILLSGGLDSAVSLASSIEKYNIKLALIFNYGQKSFQNELTASKMLSKYYKINNKVVNLDWLSEISTSSLNNKGNIPKISIENLNNKNITQETAKSVWVPNRNSLFINIAACFAEADNYTHIIIGANKEEGQTFKDNSFDFISAVNESLKHSTNNNVEVSAPLINMTKEEIVKLGIQNNLPFELIYSCYQNNVKHCGKCESCLRLKRALELNNRHDIIEKIFE